MLLFMCLAEVWLLWGSAAVCKDCLGLTLHITSGLNIAYSLPLSRYLFLFQLSRRLLSYCISSVVTTVVLWEDSSLPLSVA